MSTNCDDDQCEHGCKRRKFLCRVLGCIAVLLVIVVILAIAGWFLLLPTVPEFSLEDMAVHELNIEARSHEGRVTSFLEPTILSRNPNRLVSIHYDHIRAFVTYRNQKLTTPAYAPPMYQDHRGGADVWTPYLAGNRVPLEMKHFAHMANDWASEHLELEVKLEARIRWRIGPWMSGHHDLDVSCPAVLAFPDHVHARFQQQASSACSVDV